MSGAFATAGDLLGNLRIFLQRRGWRENLKIRHFVSIKNKEISGLKGHWRMWLLCYLSL